MSESNFALIFGEYPMNMVINLNLNKAESGYVDDNFIVWSGSGISDAACNGGYAYVNLPTNFH